ncbi:MAG TPA: peptide deformylase [Candidatus Cybelea sp.]|nr:peptide deformylase [Candidatus Cybelea sp.]
MAKRPIIVAPDPRLKVKSTKVAVVDDGIRKLMDDMLESMYEAVGLGLAAIQVGVPKRVIVIDLAKPEDKKPKPLYLVNPEVVAASESDALFEEGCLSLPGQFAEVERPSWVEIAYLDYDGKPQRLRAEGMLGVCIQHEMDHLEGVLFVDHLSALKRNMILRKLSKQKKQQLVNA